MFATGRACPPNRRFPRARRCSPSIRNGASAKHGCRCVARGGRSPISTCSRRSTCGATQATRSSALRPSRRYSATCSPHAVDFGGGHAGVPAARLSGRVLHRAAAAVPRIAAAVPRAAAVLDVAARAHGGLGRAAAARGHPQQSSRLARADHRADPDDLQSLRRLRGDGARAVAVHGAAALCRDEGHPAVVRPRGSSLGARPATRSAGSICRRRCRASAPAA